MTIMQKIKNRIDKLVNNKFQITIQPFGAKCDVWMGDFHKNITEIENTYPGAEFGDIKNLKNMAAVLEVADGGKFFVMFLSDKQGLTHEAIHLSWMILSSCGVKLTPENHEIQAYLVDHIIEEVCKNV